MSPATRPPGPRRPFLLRGAAGAALLCGTLLSCGSGIQAPDRAPTIEGEIVAVGDDVAFPEPDPSTRTLVWIEEEPDDPCGIVFFVEAETEILVGSERGDVEDLRAGRRARAWADGAIAESCPAQGSALAVQVVDG